MEIERKDLTIAIKAVSDTGTFEGYGSIFGNVDSYGDVVEAGAFKRTLNNRNTPVKLLWQHDTSKPIGIFEEIREDADGLFVKGRLALDTQLGKEAHSLLQMGALDGMSIGYSVVKDQVKSSIRFLKELKLYEVSLVTFPANEASLVNNVKSQDLRTVFDDLNEENSRLVLEYVKSLSLDLHEDPQSEDIDELDDILQGVKSRFGIKDDASSDLHSDTDNQLDETSPSTDSVKDHSLADKLKIILTTKEDK